MTTLGGRSGASPLSLSMLGSALNEEDNVAEYIERAEKFLVSLTSDFELIVIDDGSTDGTAAIVEEHQRTRPWLRLYRNAKNRGPGFNTKLAISLAGKDYLFWQRVDWSYDISQLPQYLHHLGRDCDVLQGVRQGTVSLSGLHDYQNVTVYPTRFIQSVTLKSESAFTNPECLLKVWWRGARIREFPVPFLKRRRGGGKGTQPWFVLRTVTDILGWWFRWVVLRQRAYRGRGRIIPSEP